MSEDPLLHVLFGPDPLQTTLFARHAFPDATVVDPSDRAVSSHDVARQLVIVHHSGCSWTSTEDIICKAKAAGPPRPAHAHVLHPAGGPLQALWAEQWVLAERDQLKAFVPLDEDRVQPPPDCPLFDAVHHQWCPLLTTAPQFRCQGLLLSGAAVLHADAAGGPWRLRPAARHLAVAWAQGGPRRRVIILQSGCPELFQPLKWDAAAKQLLAAVEAANLPVPVHLSLFCESAAAAAHAPAGSHLNSAVARHVAYLHRRFHLDLDDSLFLPAPLPARGAGDPAALPKALGLPWAEPEALRRRWAVAPAGDLPADWKARLGSDIVDCSAERPWFLRNVVFLGRDAAPSVPPLFPVLLRAAEAVAEERITSYPPSPVHVYDGLVLQPGQHDRWRQRYGGSIDPVEASLPPNQQLTSPKVPKRPGAASPGPEARAGSDAPPLASPTWQRSPKRMKVTPTLQFLFSPRAPTHQPSAALLSPSPPPSSASGFRPPASGSPSAEKLRRTLFAEPSAPCLAPGAPDSSTRAEDVASATTLPPSSPAPLPQDGAWQSRLLAPQLEDRGDDELSSWLQRSKPPTPASPRGGPPVELHAATSPPAPTLLRSPRPPPPPKGGRGRQVPCWTICAILSGSRGGIGIAEIGK